MGYLSVELARHNIFERKPLLLINVLEQMVLGRLSIGSSETVDDIGKDSIEDIYAYSYLKDIAIKITEYFQRGDLFEARRLLYYVFSTHFHFMPNDQDLFEVYGSLVKPIDPTYDEIMNIVDSFLARLVDAIYKDRNDSSVLSSFKYFPKYEEIENIDLYTGFSIEVEGTTYTARIIPPNDIDRIALARELRSKGYDRYGAAAKKGDVKPDYREYLLEKTLIEVFSDDGKVIGVLEIQLPNEFGTEGERLLAPYQSVVASHCDSKLVESRISSLSSMAYAEALELSGIEIKEWITSRVGAGIAAEVSSLVFLHEGIDGVLEVGLEKDRSSSILIAMGLMTAALTANRRGISELSGLFQPYLASIIKFATNVDMPSAIDETRLMDILGYNAVVNPNGTAANYEYLTEFGIYFFTNSRLPIDSSIDIEISSTQYTIPPGSIICINHRHELSVECSDGITINSNSPQDVKSLLRAEPVKDYILRNWIDLLHGNKRRSEYYVGGPKWYSMEGRYLITQLADNLNHIFSPKEAVES